MNRPRPAVIALIVSAAALAVSIAVIVAAGPERVESVGSRAGIEDAASASAQPASPGGVADAGPASAAASAGATPSPTPKYASVRIDATKPLVRESVPAPVRIVIPAIGVDAPVDAIGVDSAGRVAVPRDVSRIGWYKWGPAPGASAGSAMLTGHVDGVDQGPGEFYDLGTLTVDDTVTIERADGSTVVYRVIARESFAKTVVPLEDIFARSGPHRLTLVTCGGPFDYESLVYTDNVVVTAVPA